MIIAFTGHRPDKLGGYDLRSAIAMDVRRDLRDVITKALRKDPETKFISGMAQGVDMIAAEEVLKAKGYLIAAVPFAGQEKKWPPKAQAHYKFILDSAHEIRIIFPDGYAPWKLLGRNKWMVDHCDLLVAVWDGSAGGTSHCVQYAQEKKKPYINVWR
jgi:uncharacterized phage-like protein YoqJ